MAYLITCAGSKTPQDQIPINPSELTNLSFTNLLHESREEIINIWGGVLDWERTLPAWQLYSGNRSKLYTQVTAYNWAKHCAEIRILSALFGWIKHSDFVPYYDLKMDSLIGNQKVCKKWHQMNVLQEIINVNDIDLLSSNYKRAINGNGNSVAVEPTAHFADHYGVHKGKWLNSQLDILEC